MHKITNPIFQELLKLKLINKKNIVKISDSTRDKKIKVFKDLKSQIIFLEKSVVISNYYSIFGNQTKKLYSSPHEMDVRGKILKTKHFSGSRGLIGVNDKRRYSMFKKHLLKKEVLDYGCCWGGFLSLLKNYSKSCSGVELRKACVQYIKKNYKSIDAKDNLTKFDKNFDVITLFHVLEHIPKQVETLKEIRKKIKKNGKIIIEVPSALDYLIFIDLPEFKKFTFWSEHLILHTEKSLKKVLKASGFKKIKVNYLQIYGYANHLGWLLTKRPGGHKYFKEYVDKKFDLDYRNYLIRRKQTDTLIAIAEN
jgi:2-polyprenyl-3-methyl-5-hydroxy-6-metoxy-1,4-benzoquinol methylase|tara:strand:+ start:237 stop:1163 length:927 start_codon:yes stop_codon:yes gene_type:complete